MYDTYIHTVKYKYKGYTLLYTQKKKNYNDKINKYKYMYIYINFVCRCEHYCGYCTHEYNKKSIPEPLQLNYLTYYMAKLYTIKHYFDFDFCRV